MRQAPPLNRALRYPVTAGVSLLAVIGTVGCWYGKDFSALSMNPLAWHGEPWRLLTSALPHVNVIHLLFNLYWTWVFGTALEEVYGAGRTSLLMAALAIVSSAAEYALFAGGVGLSGVGYGLFAYLWVAGKRDRRFEDVVDGQTVQLFAGWFVLCVVLTATNVMKVGNAAHAAGAVGGALFGAAVSARSVGGRRSAAYAAVAFFSLAFAGATWGRPWVNLGGRDAGVESARLGYEALRDGRDASAEHFLAESVRVFDRESTWWFNLGLAHQRLQDLAGARQAYSRASELEPSNKKYSDALKGVGGR